MKNNSSNKKTKKGTKKGDRLLFHKFRSGLIYQTHTFKKVAYFLFFPYVEEHDWKAKSFKFASPIPKYSYVMNDHLFLTEMEMLEVAWFNLIYWEILIKIG